VSERRQRIGGAAKGEQPNDPSLETIERACERSADERLHDDEDGCQQERVVESSRPHDDEKRESAEQPECEVLHPGERAKRKTPALLQ
jgi:hypothetical protein